MIKDAEGSVFRHRRVDFYVSVRGCAGARVRGYARVSIGIGRVRSSGKMGKIEEGEA
jgi:hypothetical protein